MAFNYSPKIVTNGLVMYLDAANPASYPRSGTSWRDVSRGVNNCSLINGPTFSAESSGIITTDGTNDYILYGKNLNGFTKNIHFDLNWSIEVWMNVVTMSSFKYIYGAYNGGPAQVGAGIWISNGSGGFLNLSLHFNNSVAIGGTNQSDILNCQGLWKQWVITSEDALNYRYYLNGVLKGSSTYNWRDSANRVDAQSTYDYCFAANNVDLSTCLNAKFGNCKIYNRALSASEVLQNYNATRTRFGL